MRRGEGVALLAVAAALVVAGVTWLFGPFGLLGAGLVLAAFALFLTDVEE